VLALSRRWRSVVWRVSSSCWRASHRRDLETLLGLAQPQREGVGLLLALDELALGILLLREGGNTGHGKQQDEATHHCVRRAAGSGRVPAAGCVRCVRGRGIETIALVQAQGFAQLLQFQSRKAGGYPMQPRGVVSPGSRGQGLSRLA